MFWRGVWGYLPAQVVQGVVGFLTIVVFTRLLSPDDFGLMALVGRRRRMLGYLQKVDIERYRSLIERLGLRK